MKYNNLKTQLKEKLNGLNIDEKIAEKIVKNIDKSDKLKAADATKHLEKALAIVNIISSIELQTTMDIPLHTEIIKGAHVVINDDGAIYDQLREHANERLSSHYKNHKVDNKQDLSISAAAAGFNEFLCGVKKGEDGKLHTWFQFEGHSLQRDKEMEGIFSNIINTILALVGLNINKILHGGDFVSYVLNFKKKNIGQYGNSDFTESNPIALVVKESSLDAETSPLDANTSSQSVDSRTLIIVDNKVFFNDPTSEVGNAQDTEVNHSIK